MSVLVHQGSNTTAAVQLKHDWAIQFKNSKWMKNLIVLIKPISFQFSQEYSV